MLRRLKPRLLACGRPSPSGDGEFISSVPSAQADGRLKARSRDFSRRVQGLSGQTKLFFPHQSPIHLSRFNHEVRATDWIRF